MGSGPEQGDRTLRLHVAVDGCDGWSGRVARPTADGTDGPLATLAGARDRLRAIRGAGRLTGPAEVVVQAGRYELSETLRFTRDDLGDASTPVTYRAAGDGEVRLSGSRRLTGFAPAEGGLVKLALHHADLAALPLRQVCFDGAWLRPARYPSYDPDDPVAGGWAFVDGEPVDYHEHGHGERDRFAFSDPRPATWPDLDGVEVVIYPRYNYTNDVIGVASIDPATHEVTLDGLASYAIYPNDRFYFQHVLAELDQPGEWCLDRRAETLYLYPPGPVDEAVVETPVLESVIVVDGEVPPARFHSKEKDTWVDHDALFAAQREPELYTAGHLSFVGLTVEGCVDDAIVIRNARACRVVGCTVRTAGGFGVRVFSGAACEVTDCDVADVGKGGIELSGGFRSPFGGVYLPCDHAASNNYIHHFGQVHSHIGGIGINGVGITVDHNLIHDGPRWGIISRGNDNVLEYNHIRHVCLASADTAAIYLVDRDLTMHGTKIRYNYVHDIPGFDRVNGVWTSPAFSFGIYLDDFTSGVEIRGNIVHGTPRAGIFVHAGQDVVVEENASLSEGREALYLRRWPPEMEMERCGTYGQALRRNTVRRNIWGPSDNTYAINLLGTDVDALDLDTNEIDDNLIIGASGGVRADEVTSPWSQWQATGRDVRTTSVTRDEIFADGTFELVDGPATRLGITLPALDEIGLRPSSHRPDWPLVEAVGARERVVPSTRTS